MLKNGLRTTTALVIVGTLSFLAAQSMAVARPAPPGAGRDRNNEFLCTYGQFDVKRFYKQISNSQYSTWTHIAVPIIGHGQVVDRIGVKVGQSSYTSGTEFSVGIYTNSRKGFPGDPISVGHATAPQKCEDVFVRITPAKLKKNKTYWIEETIEQNRDSGVTDLYWAVDPKMQNRAYSQYHRYSASLSGTSSSYTSPWTELSAGPHVRLR